MALRSINAYLIHTMRSESVARAYDSYIADSLNVVACNKHYEDRPAWREIYNEMYGIKDTRTAQEIIEQTINRHKDFNGEEVKFGQ